MVTAFNKIMAGAQDVFAYSEGDPSRGISHVIMVVDVKAIRQKAGFSQAAFAKALLTLISKDPDAPRLVLQNC